MRLAQNSDTEYYPYGLWWGTGVPRVTPVMGHDSGETATLNVVQVINPTLTNEVQFSGRYNNFPCKSADPSKVVNAQFNKDLPGVNWLKGSNGSVYTRTAAAPAVWNGVDNNSGCQITGRGQGMSTTGFMATRPHLSLPTV